MVIVTHALPTVAADSQETVCEKCFKCSGNVSCHLGAALWEHYVRVQLVAPQVGQHFLLIVEGSKSSHVYHENRTEITGAQRLCQLVHPVLGSQNWAELDQGFWGGSVPSPVKVDFTSGSQGLGYSGKAHEVSQLLLINKICTLSDFKGNLSLNYWSQDKLTTKPSQ